MKRTFCILAATFLFSATAFADIAKPTKSPSSKEKAAIDTLLDIRLDSDAKEARLIIPRSQLQQLRAELESLDDGSDHTAAVSGSTGMSRTQTIMSGLFLSLAFVVGGVWFLRSGRAATKTGKGAVVALVISFVATAATFVFANAGPPSEARSITGKMFTPAVHMYGFGSGKIKLEVGDDDRNVVRLIVPNPPKAEATPRTEE